MFTQSSLVCLHLKVQLQVMYPLEGDPQIWLQFYSKTMDPPVTSWPTY
jgi:hypothetical protein